MKQWIDRRQFVRTGLAVAGGLAVGGASSAFAGEAVPPGTVLRVGDQKGGSRALMDAAGVLNDLPYRIEWSLFASASTLLEALNAKAIDVGAVGDAPFLFAYAGGAPVKVALALSPGPERATPGFAILVVRNSPIQAPSDLIGRSVATIRGSTGHYFLLRALDQYGIKHGDIKLVFLNPSDAKAALEGGSIDAWSIWEPYVSLAELQDGARPVIDGSQVPRTEYGFHVASQQAIAHNHGALADYLRRVVLANEWGRDNNDRFAEVWARETGLPMEIARRACIGYLSLFHPVRLDGTVVEALGKIAEVYRQGNIPIGPMDLAAAFDPSFSAMLIP
jgi:sulfonate transport system substrate-binding protein